MTPGSSWCLIDFDDRPRERTLVVQVAG